MITIYKENKEVIRFALSRETVDEPENYYYFDNLITIEKEFMRFMTDIAKETLTEEMLEVCLQMLYVGKIFSKGLR